MSEPEKKGGISGALITVLVIIVGAVSYGTVRYISEVGFSQLFDSVQQGQTKQNVNDYFSNTEQWRSFSSPAGQFTVLFPTYPTHDKQYLNIAGANNPVPYDSYLSEDANTSAFLVGMIAYPSEVDFTQPDNNLTGALNGIAVAMNGEVISSSLGYFQGYRSMEFLIASGTTYAKGRAILVDHTMYIVERAYEGTTDSDGGYQKFINSFTFNF